MGIFKRKRSEPRSWEAVQGLIERLSALCDNTFARRFYMHIDSTGTVRISMTVSGAEFTGNGKTPWLAAQHISEQAVLLSAQVGAILADEAAAIAKAA